MDKKILVMTLLLYLTSISFVNKKNLEKYHMGSGVNITKINNYEFSKKDKLAIDKLENMNFSTLVINDIYYQKSINSSFIENTDFFNERYLGDFIRFSKNEFSFVLRHLLNSRDKKSRTKIMPNNILEWSKNYDKSVSDLAKKADYLDIGEINIGSELDSLILNQPQVFESAIKAIKKTGYSGKISIATVFSGDNSIEKIKILNELDVDKIGIDFYVSAKNEKLSKENKFHEYLYYLKKIVDASDKPIEICEFGFRSVEDGNKSPMFNYKLKGNEDYKIQEESYKNFYKALEFISAFKISNINIWSQDTYDFRIDILDNPIMRSDGVWNIGYSPFNKLAEKEIEKFNKKIRLYKNINYEISK